MCPPGCVPAVETVVYWALLGLEVDAPAEVGALGPLAGVGAWGHGLLACELGVGALAMGAHVRVLTGDVIAPLALGIVVKAVTLGGRGTCLAGPGVVGSAKKGLVSDNGRGL